MRKLLFVLLVFTSSQLECFAQVVETKPSKWSLSLQTKLGFAKYQQSGFVTLNGMSTGFDVFVTRNLGSSLNLSSGIIVSEFNANRTVAGEEIRLQNSYVQIPLLLGTDLDFSDESANTPITFRVAIGPSANYLAEALVETDADTSKDRNVGWNFGLISQVNIDFRISGKSSLYLGMQGQSDFSRIKNNGSESKIEQAANFVFGFRRKF